MGSRDCQNPSRCLPRTSRVSEKILDYYLKYGRDRDLQKFMRLYSPCSSRSRSQSVSSTSASDEGTALRRLFHIHGCPMESVDVEVRSGDQPAGADASDPAALEAQQERIIPIRMEAQQKRLAASSENLQTPEKAHRAAAARTPDSVAKSHKRLEWDSMGDVGYKKSMSTSNISVLERALLKELFQTSSLSANASEADLKKLEQEIQHQEAHAHTPPLASSTFVEPKKASTRNAPNERPKYRSQSTNTSRSLQKNFEKSVQTSLRYPGANSREVQVSMSPSHCASSSSAMCGTATPSSFEYYSSRSSAQSECTSQSNLGSSYHHSTRHHKTKSASSAAPPPPEEFIANINEILASKCRKVLSDKNQQRSRDLSESGSRRRAEVEQFQQLQATLRKALDENKENTNSTLPAKRSPQVDLGIQLLCSLIDAKNLSQREKKRLVRDIVKRISSMGISSEDGREETTAPTPSTSGRNISTSELTSSSSHNEHSANTGSRQSEPLNMQELVANLPIVDNEPKTASGNSERSLSETCDRRIPSNDVRRSSPPTTSARAEQLSSASTYNRRPSVKTDTDVPTETSHDPARVFRSTPAIPINKGSTSECKSTSTHMTVAARASHRASSSSLTSSRELITQKATNGDRNEAATDAEEDTMREWLNPMTQSEVEYEEKRRAQAKSAKKREKPIRESHKTKPDSERNVQLYWIEGEIQRLESLRSLLVKQSAAKPQQQTTTDSEYGNNYTSVQTDTTMKSDVGDKIYDTVCSEKSSPSHPDTVKSSDKGSSRQHRREDKVILEGTKGDLVHPNGEAKRSKECKRETPLVYETPAGTAQHGSSSTGSPSKHRCRAGAETTITNDTRFSYECKLNAWSTKNLPPTGRPTAARTQRSKMDTPTGSNESTSVCSFVQQRKREFIEHYKNKMKHHHEQLLQQERRHKAQQQLSKQDQERCSARLPHHSYSMPHTMYQHVPIHQHSAPNYCSHPSHVHVHPPCHGPPTIPPPPPPPPPPSMAPVAQHAGSPNNRNPNSSSSLFCISSEVSVPMGSSNASCSTTTTTHQYDDVAGGVGPCVGVQTSGSMIRTRPILRRCIAPVQQQAHCAPARVHVKPKAIAYVITFDRDTSSEQLTSSATLPSEKPSSPLTLQEHLERAKPEFCAHTKERKAILNKMHSLRQERERELREMVEDSSIASLDRKVDRLPPPPTKQIRIFATKEMKAMTNKRCATLPEVLEKQERAHEERRRRSNRILRDLFNRRLQKRVRNGKLSLNHSKTVI